MKALRKYINLRNDWQKIFGGEEIDVSKLDNAMAQRIFSILDGELSPENLHCDGEITPAAARRKAKVFRAAGNDLLVAGYWPESEWSEFK